MTELVDLKIHACFTIFQFISTKMSKCIDYDYPIVDKIQCTNDTKQYDWFLKYTIMHSLQFSRVTELGHIFRGDC